MAEYQSETIKLRVRKGVQVEVEEVDDVGADPDDRVRGDREAQVVLPLDLKVAVQRVPREPELADRAVVVTMCG